MKCLAGTPKEIEFTCNICSTKNSWQLNQSHREVPSCSRCHSTPRFRGLMMALADRMYGDQRCMEQFVENKQVRGLGMSEWSGYAERLGSKFDFTNSFYHMEPIFDVTSENVSSFSDFDFIICTEVFEHIERPLQRAFDNLAKVLKPDGILVFSAPTMDFDETIEHYPDLYQYEIAQFKNRWIIINKTRAGHFQVFEQPVFHGGPGTVLEMRIFSEQALVTGLTNAGFRDIKIYNEPCFDVGYYWPAVAERAPEIQSLALGYVMSAVKS